MEILVLDLIVITFYGYILSLRVFNGHPIEFTKLEQYRSKKNPNKSKGFRGQHFKFLKKTQINELVIQAAKKFFKHKHDFFQNWSNYIFEHI
ncbi:MAG: hypothetical protein K2X81_15550, partial [Candidatus Obscuribacterales bacterium]|nr:hypothetical protein [Candidatus Obscuribacterales bacterium]